MTKGGSSMLRYTIGFAVAALCAAILGFGGVADYSLAMVGKIVFAIACGLAVLCFTGTKRKKADPWE